MLPLLKDNIENTELQFFIDYFLPLLAHLREKGTEFSLQLSLSKLVFSDTLAPDRMRL